MKNLNLDQLGVQGMSTHEMNEQNGGDSIGTLGMMLLSQLVKSAVTVVADIIKSEWR